MAPILASSFGKNSNEIFYAGIEGKVRTVGLNADLSREVGKHNAPISCLQYNDSHKLVISGSWDKTVGTNIIFLSML